MTTKGYTRLIVALIGSLILSLACNTTTTSTEITTHILIVQPEDGRTPVISAISNAKSSVDLTIYELNDATIETALKEARSNGVEVKILYNYFSFSSPKKENVQKTMASLETAGILTKKACPEFEVTHQKTFTFDSSKSIIMTFNLESNYFGGTRDFGIITIDPSEVSEILKVFQADWNYKKVTPEVASLVWSNNNSREKILAPFSHQVLASVGIYYPQLHSLFC